MGSGSDAFEPADSADETGAGRLRKAPTAFRTISEVADELHVPQHVLRFWETRFAEVRPLKRGGGRRYYRPDDVELLRRISDLLYVQGYTIKGVQRVLREGEGAPEHADDRVARPDAAPGDTTFVPAQTLTDEFTAPSSAYPPSPADWFPEGTDHPQNGGQGQVDQVAPPPSELWPIMDDGDNDAEPVSAPEPWAEQPVDAHVVPEPDGHAAELESRVERLARENGALREGLRMVMEELQLLREHLPV
ncbi:MerR family transcriptional regulator [Ameyamaea chiangmaiensis]|uniref:MerR family transcriptional regulator n=1 Tax=Ameyamaea chiangmaiensis TaxID=442969 RepID=UPI0038D12CEC